MIIIRLIQCTSIIRHRLALGRFCASKAAPGAEKLVYVAPFRKALMLLKTTSVALSVGRVTAETLSLFSRRCRHVFHVQEANIYKGLQGFANFQVNNTPFYVHTEPEMFKDRILLAKLLGTHVS